MTGGSVTSVAAFGGGIVSFLSPCVLPIVPAYLSMIRGLPHGGRVTVAIGGSGDSFRCRAERSI